MNDNFLKDKIIAHRGLFNKKENIPENSLLSYKKAIDKGYGIEIDLHILADGKVVVFHDDNLIRMTGKNKELKTCTYDDIKELTLDNTNEHIPYLEDVLALVDGKVPLLIEYKYDVKDRSLEEKSMEILKDYKGKFAIQSFDPFSVKWFKDNYSEILRGQLSSNYKGEKIGFFKKFILKNVFTNFLNKPDFISYNISSLPSNRIKYLRSKGILIGGWTIRNKEDYEKAKKYCDFFICENIEDYIK